MHVPVRFQSRLITTAGYEFYGAVMPASDPQGAAAEFITPRLWLRVHPDVDVQAKDEIADSAGRRFLLAHHDMVDRVYRTFRLFELVSQVSWKRATTTTDTLTGLTKTTGQQELGPIWCLLEPRGRLFPDVQTHIPPNAGSLVTGKSIALGDTIDGRKVTRINPVLRVWLAEID